MNVQQYFTDSSKTLIKPFPNCFGEPQGPIEKVLGLLGSEMDDEDDEGRKKSRALHSLPTPG